MLALKEQTHVSMLFVKGEYQGQGVGSMLLAQAEQLGRQHGAQRLTVNAAPSAVGFYANRGFVPQGPEQVQEGMRFTPMVKELIRVKTQ